MNIPEAIHFFVSEGTRFIAPIGIGAEWVLVAIAAILVSAAPPIKSNRRFLAVRDAFHRLANRKRTAVLICAVLPVAIRLAMLPFIPAPDPSIHDEFSHLLLADTLAHGRLTNPTPPMWRHFESIHIIQRPTYNSMYPPAQGSVLALGQVVFRDPWAGVEIGIALMFGAMCWMMQGWLPPAWALFGTLLPILKLGLVGFWVNSYLGGSVPAFGGALLIGSIPRIKREHASALPAALMGFGAVVLMNSRPFEGAVLAISALLYLAPTLIRRASRSPANVAKSFVLPAGAILVCGFLFTGYYCWRVTGNPFRMPYQVNRDTYGWPENLAFLPPKKLKLEHPVLQAMYLKEVRHREIYNSPEAFLDDLVTRVFDNWAYLIGPVLTIPLLFLPLVFLDSRSRPLVVFLFVMLFLNLFQMLLYPYHLSPILPVLYAMVAQGSRHAYVGISRFGRRRGLYFAALLPVCLVLVCALKQEAEVLGIPLSSYWERGYELQRDARASIVAWLDARPGKQLVIVRYSSDHSVNQEWVYNLADIDNSKIVWAREMDETSDGRLLKYFSDRQAWLLEADVYPQRVVPYPDATATCSINSAACGLCRAASNR